MGCWKMTDDQNDELNDEEILKIIEDSEDKKATGPEGISNEMLKKGGRSLINSILRMLKMVYKTEKIPDSWNKAFIKNIYKGKGSKKEMNNYRGIILNPHIAKIFEKIVENKESSTLQNMSEYQCGARKGKSVWEHHFTIRTIMEEAKIENEEITAVYFDIMKCFDKMGLKKATGPEGISDEMLKKGGRSLINSILRMLKMVYKTEKIPDAWNKAFIKNIYKGKGSKKEMNNYRGIILNPHIAKIFEKIVENKES